MPDDCRFLFSSVYCCYIRKERKKGKERKGKKAPNHSMENITDC